MRMLPIATLIVSAVVIVGLGPLAAGPQDRPAAQTSREKALTELVAAERAFSRTSEERGIREAFLTWLAPSAVVFRPGPVAGRPVYEKMDPGNPAVLTWEPEFAEVASSGELGYTTGPYTYSPGRGIEPSDFGHYVSVWQKQPDGTWKVLLDIGVSYPAGARAARSGQVEGPAATAPADVLSPERLRDEEYAFGQVSASVLRETSAKGQRKALAQLGTDDIRVYRPGSPPTVGRSRIRRIVGDRAGRVTAGSLGDGVKIVNGMSWSGDLAYSYGTAVLGDAPGNPAKVVFFRIWRKVPPGRWRVCLDVELPGLSPS
jgi:ketosteroid isomerase-like protein